MVWMDGTGVGVQVSGGVGGAGVLNSCFKRGVLSLGLSLPLGLFRLV